MHPNKKQKILVIFHDITGDTLSNKKLNTIISELFIKGRRLNILSCFCYKILFCCSQKY